MNVSVVDYGMGNLHSVYRKLVQLGAHPTITSDYKLILNADKIVLPGVGHFSKAIENLKQLGIDDVLNEAVLIKKKPILGICLGMQLMARESEEGSALGLGWIDAKVVKFNVQDKIRYKVPQTGWNGIRACKESLLLTGITDKDEFYFLHSYHYKEGQKQDELASTEYEYRFVSAIEKENIFGTQFHPEKSHDSGARLLQNFIQL
jgi:glutamine amidotransferase